MYRRMSLGDRPCFVSNHASFVFGEKRRGSLRLQCLTLTDLRRVSRGSLSHLALGVAGCGEK